MRAAGGRTSPGDDASRGVARGETGSGLADC